MEDPTDYTKLSKEEVLNLRRLVLRGFDLLLDLRHWQCLCAVGRKHHQTPTEVLAGILEKVFVQDLGMITPLDDLLDQPLKYVRTYLQRIRFQPKKLRKLLARRDRELVMTAHLFPKEFARREGQKEDFITQVRQLAGYKPELNHSDRRKPQGDEKRLNQLLKRLRKKRDP